MLRRVIIGRSRTERRYVVDLETSEEVAIRARLEALCVADTISDYAIETYWIDQTDKGRLLGVLAELEQPREGRSS